MPNSKRKREPRKLTPKVGRSLRTIADDELGEVSGGMPPAEPKCVGSPPPICWP